MEIATGNSVNSSADKAIAAAWMQIKTRLSQSPALLLCSASANYPADKLRQQLLNQLPVGCKIAGASSCLGAMNNHGFHSTDDTGLSLIAFADNKGDFGVGLCPQSADPAQSAAIAIKQAIEDAQRPGELPDLIWLSASPGHEEAILQGIATVVGSHVPIVGGSSADNTISGKWWQFDNKDVENEGVLVIAMYPSCQVEVSLQSGYAPTSRTGRVTSADARTLYTIDNQPAAQQYNRWTNGLITAQLTGGNILQATTFHPLGRVAGRIEDIPYFELLHPEQVLDTGAMQVFSNVSTGDQLTLMQSSAASLTRRAGSIIDGIIERNHWQKTQLTGALVVYCAGCMLGIQDTMQQVCQGIQHALGDAPFQSMFTFGEQGCFIDGTNHHANLMISVVIFNKN